MQQTDSPEADCRRHPDDPTCFFANQAVAGAMDQQMREFREIVTEAVAAGFKTAIRETLTDDETMRATTASLAAHSGKLLQMKVGGAVFAGLTRLLGMVAIFLIVLGIAGWQPALKVWSVLGLKP